MPVSGNASDSAENAGIGIGKYPSQTHLFIFLILVKCLIYCIRFPKQSILRINLEAQSNNNTPFACGFFMKKTDFKPFLKNDHDHVLQQKMDL